jgi:hypothetical protein
LAPAGRGFDFGPIQRDGAHLQEAHVAGEGQELPEAGGDQRGVFAPEVGDRIVVGMQVGAQVAHGEVLVGGALDLARAHDPVAVAVDEDGQHHPGRVLGIARAAVVDLRAGEVEFLHDFPHEGRASRAMTSGYGPAGPASGVFIFTNG